MPMRDARINKTVVMEYNIENRGQKTEDRGKVYVIPDPDPESPYIYCKIKFYINEPQNSSILTKSPHFLQKTALKPLLSQNPVEKTKNIFSICINYGPPRSGGPFLYIEVFLDTREKLDSLIADACNAAAVSLVEADWFRAGKRKVLRLYIDKPEGVTVDDCAKVSRNLSDALDADPDLIDGAYTLEVSSPGLDRPLKSDADFNRNIGRRIRVTRSTGKPAAGVLKSFNDESLTLELKGKAGEIVVPRAEILSAKVDVEI